MRRDQALAILREQLPALHQLGVLRLGLFGSVARDEAGPASDVDVLVEIDGPLRLQRRMAVQELLEVAFGCPVDVVSYSALKPRAAAEAARDAIHVA